jgi:hypothetical protein
MFAYSGIIEQNMHPPARGVTKLADSSAPPMAVTHVENAGAKGINRHIRYGFGNACGVDIIEAAIPATLGKMMGSGPANSRSGTGYKDRFPATRFTHVHSPLEGFARQREALF